jgi:hypothetical protein
MRSIVLVLRLNAQYVIGGKNQPTSYPYLAGGATGAGPVTRPPAQLLPLTSGDRKEIQAGGSSRTTTHKVNNKMLESK